MYEEGDKPAEQHHISTEDAVHQLIRSHTARRGPVQQLGICLVLACLAASLVAGAGCEEMLSSPSVSGTGRGETPAVDGVDGVPPRPSQLVADLPAREADKIRIASYNIQVFGITKEAKVGVMQVLAEIVRQFDVIAIQEIRCSDQQLLTRFMALINQHGHAYDYVIGPRLGRTVSKEQYAFIYDTTRLTVDQRSIQTVDDPDDLLHREPLITRFVFNQLPAGQGFSFTLINMHTDPDEAGEEVDVLDDVFLSARADGRYEEDVILLGDLNVDHTRLGQLGGVPGIICTVHGEATNTARSRSYDNIVFDPAATSEYTGRAGVLDVQRVFGLTDQQAKEVSDHLPVWAEFSVYEQRASSLAARPR